MRRPSEKGEGPEPEVPDPWPLDDMTAKQNEVLQRLKITMIGHSMGTIVMNELVQLCPDLPYKSLVDMA